MNDTCVYRHLKPCGEVFYVGIGCAQRPYSNSDRNKFWHNIVAKYGYEVEIVAECLSWAEACKLEKSLIKLYGRRDLGTGTLVNLTDGGDGIKGLIHSVETRQKIGAAHKGKLVTEETRRKMSAANKISQSGKKHSEETRQKISAAAQNMSAEHRQKLSAAKKGKPALNRKLTFKQAEEIRSRYQTEKTSTYKLGAEYGVSSGTIDRIINNKIYLT